MTQTLEPTFDAAEQAVLGEIDRHLHARGWAEHATVISLLRNWRELSETVNRYDFTIDDYTNDLTARDGLEIVLAECPEPLRTKLGTCIEEFDKEFVSRTEQDIEGRVGRFFRIDNSSGWWWKRRPAAGPLAEYLAQSS